MRAISTSDLLVEVMLPVTDVKWNWFIFWTSSNQGLGRAGEHVSTDLFPDFSCTHGRICVYGRYPSEDVLLWGQRNICKKILQSSRFNVLADFYIKVFGLRFVIIKFFKRKIANQKEPWNQFMTSFSRSRPAIENPTSRNLKCLFVSFVFPFLTKNIMGHFNYYYPNGPLKCTYWVEELYLTD